MPTPPPAPWCACPYVGLDGSGGKEEGAARARLGRCGSGSGGPPGAPWRCARGSPRRDVRRRLGRWLCARMATWSWWGPPGASWRSTRLPMLGRAPPAAFDPLRPPLLHHHHLLLLLLLLFLLLLLLHRRQSPRRWECMARAWARWRGTRPTACWRCRAPTTAAGGGGGFGGAAGARRRR